MGGLCFSNVKGMAYYMSGNVFYVVEQLCNGCENCSLVCSFVLNKSKFGKKSNITMIRAEEAGYNQPGLVGTGYDEPVVGCNSEPCGDEPLCVKYCPTGALIYDTQENILERKKQLLVSWKTNAESRVRAPWAQRRR